MRWMDRAYVSWMPRKACFAGGWGEEAEIRSTLTGSWRDAPPARCRIRWTRARTHGSRRIRDGCFDSPEQALPPESRLAAVRLIEPRHAAPRGLAVVLAAWGEEGWSSRTRLFGPAVEGGIAILMLEAAFYGRRRRVGQRSTQLRTVSDFMLMGRATVREGLALTAWAREEGYAAVGVAGFSMGGNLSVIAGALSPTPLRLAAIAPSATPATVFLDGPLRRDIAWDRLGLGGEVRLREAMEAVDVLRLPPLASTRGVVLVGTRRDEIVAPRDVEAIGAHWGVEPRWLPDGHVSAVLRRPRSFARALTAAFA